MFQPNITWPSEPKSAYVVIFLSILIAAVLITVFLYSLGFNFYVSDISGYVKDVDNIFLPYNPFHIAGYPMTIAIFDYLTGHILPLIIVMWFITLTTTVLSSFIVWKLSSPIEHIENRVIVVAVFVLWPLTGLTYVVYPVADSLAIFFIFLAWYYHSSGHEKRMVAAFSVALLCHKMMWVVVPLIWGLIFLSSCRHNLQRYIAYSVVIPIPLAVLWYGGYLHHGNAVWLFQSSISVETAVHSISPVLGGAITTIIEHGTVGAVKVSFCLLPVFVGLLILYRSWKAATINAFAIGIALSIIMLFVFISPNTLWSVARFGKMIVPALLMTLIARKYKAVRPVVLVATILVLFLSQLVYSVYMTKYFQ